MLHARDPIPRPSRILVVICVVVAVLLPALTIGTCLVLSPSSSGDHTATARTLLVECLRRDPIAPQCVHLVDQARLWEARAKYELGMRPHCGDIVDVSIDTLHTSGSVFSSSDGWFTSRSELSGTFSAQRCRGTFELALRTADETTRIDDLALDEIDPSESERSPQALTADAPETAPPPSGDKARASGDAMPATATVSPAATCDELRVPGLRRIDCLVHADGDDVLDVLGRASCRRDLDHAVALSGVDGHVLWQEDLEGELACAGDEHVLTQSADGRLAVRQLATGERAITEPAGKLTRAVAGFDCVFVQTDRGTSTLSLEGEPLDDCRRWFSPSESTVLSRGPRRRSVALAEPVYEARHDRDAFAVRHSLVARTRDVSEMMTPPPHSYRAKILWTVELPAGMRVDDRDRYRLSAAGSTVLVLVRLGEPESASWRMASFHADDGRPMFEGDTSSLSSAPVRFVETNGPQIVLGWDHGVIAIDAATGATRWSLLAPISR